MTGIKLPVAIDPQKFRLSQFSHEVPRVFITNGAPVIALA